MPRTTTKRLITSLLACSVVVGLAACSSPARRVEIGETTKDELNNKLPYPVWYVEFVDASSADLLQRLPAMRQISQTPGPVKVLLGNVNNKTGIVGTEEFEQVMAGIRSNLIRADASYDKLQFLEERRRVESLAVKERVATAPAPPQAGAEEISWAGGQYYVPDYDANTTYGLFMDVYRIGREDTGMYTMELQVVSLATNDILYSYRDQIKQVSD